MSLGLYGKNQWLYTKTRINNRIWGIRHMEMGLYELIVRWYLYLG